MGIGNAIATYSFAKTPLKAAQAPLAAASGIQGSLAIVALFDDASGWGTAFGIRGSASVSMAAEVEVDGEWWWILRRAMVGG